MASIRAVIADARDVIGLMGDIEMVYSRKVIVAHSSRVCTVRFGLVLTVLLTQPLFSDAGDRESSLRILDNPSWHETDPWIKKYREEELRDPSRKSIGRVNAAIHSREISALQDVLSIEQAHAERTQLLIKYLSHHNTGVALLAAGELISQGDWTSYHHIKRIIVGLEPRVWANILERIPAAERRPEALELARIVLQRSPCQGNSQDRSQAELAAAKILIRSADETDQELIRTVVEQCSDVPFLWVVASRLKDPGKLLDVARRVYEQTINSVGLRNAAGLLVSREDVAIQKKLMASILDYAREFADPGIEGWIRDSSRYPSDPEVSAKLARMIDGQILLALLRELELSVVDAHVQELTRYRHGTTGHAVLCILARRIPERLVAQFEAAADVPPEVYPALFIAVRFQPELEPRVRTLIPAAEFGELSQRAQKDGVNSIAFPASTLTLWD